MYYIGTSWKMNKGLAESRAFVTALEEWRGWHESIRPFVLPSHTALAAVHEALAETSGVWLGAQNAHWQPHGALTGEVSMEQVKDAGARLIEIGHSERRAMFNETDESVLLKTRRALDTALQPLVCIGETAAVRTAGAQRDFVLGQASQALAGLDPDQLSQVLLAYEPVWAIGEFGREPEVDEIAEIIGVLDDEWPDLGAVLYGGSVNAHNVLDLLSIPGNSGLFIGRAAWDVRDYIGILELASNHVTGSFARH